MLESRATRDWHVSGWWDDRELPWRGDCDDSKPEPLREGPHQPIAFHMISLVALAVTVHRVGAAEGGR